MLESVAELEKKKEDKEGEEYQLKIQQLQDEIKSYKYVQLEALPCPRCKAKIQKDGG